MAPSCQCQVQLLNLKFLRPALKPASGLAARRAAESAATPTAENTRKELDPSCPAGLSHTEARLLHRLSHLPSQPTTRGGPSDPATVTPLRAPLHHDPRATPQASLRLSGSLSDSSPHWQVHLLSTGKFTLQVSRLRHSSGPPGRARRLRSRDRNRK
jgi:hypothetical protein